MYISKKRN